MTKHMIDLRDSFSKQASRDAFRDVVQDNIENAADYEPRQVAKACEDKLYHDLNSLIDELYHNYDNRAEDALGELPDPISFYTHVDLASWLEDDLINGGFDILKLDNGAGYTILLND